MDSGNQILGPMDTLFQIADGVTSARGEIVRIAHRISIHPYHSVYKTTIHYKINSDINQGFLSIPKSNDSAIEDMQISVSGPGITPNTVSKGLQALKKAEADALVLKSNFNNLVQGIASEDVKRSTILLFQIGGLKKGYEVKVTIQHNMDTKVIYSADRTLISAVLPAGLSLLYEEPVRTTSNDQALKDYYKKLKSITVLEELICTLKVPSQDDVIISSPQKTPTIKLLTYSSIQDERVTTAALRGTKLTLLNPKYDDWSRFRIDVMISGSAGTQDISQNHQMKLEFMQSVASSSDLAPLPATGLLRLRHFTPFPDHVQQDMQQNAKYRDPDLPEIEVFKKYMNTKQKFDVFFLLDQSGSMTDCNRHNLAINGVKTSLRSLVPGSCRYNIYTFATSYKKLHPNLMDTNEPNIKSTEKILDALESGGTTVPFGAFDEIFRIPMEPNRKRILIFLSDGELTDKEPETLTLIKKNMDSNQNIMLCGLCVGRDGPVDFFNKIKPLTNGGVIAYLDDSENIPNAYINLLKSSFYPTFWLTNFKVSGAKALYMYPALDFLQAPQAEVTTVSFLLSELTPTVTLSYDVYFGSRPVQTGLQQSCNTGVKSTEAEAMMRIEAQKIVKILIEHQDRASSGGTNQDPNKQNPFNKIMKGSKTRMLHFIDRPQLLKFEEDLIRLGLRFKLVTPYTSLVVNIEGINKPTSSQPHFPPTMYMHTTTSYLSASRNQSIMQDFQNVRGKFGSIVQQEFEQLLEDEATMTSFGVGGKIVYSPESAQKFVALGVLTQERANRIQTIQSQDHKDYYFTKYLVMMILAFKGDSERWSLILSKCCAYLEECSKLGYHKVPDHNPFAQKPAGSSFIL